MSVKLKTKEKHNPAIQDQDRSQNVQVYRFKKCFLCASYTIYSHGSVGGDNIQIKDLSLTL